MNVKELIHQYYLMNAFVAGVSVKEKDNFKRRQERYETLNSNFLFDEGV